MKKKIIALIALLLFSFLPVSNVFSEEVLTEERREELIEKYIELKSRLNYLRWYVQKFEIEEELDSASYLVVNLYNDSTLLEKNSKFRYSIASITKLMSSVVALENTDINEEIVITEEMLYPPEIPLLQRYGQSPFLFPGLSISGEILLKASLIQSANAATQSLTHLVKEDDFIDLMNKKAKELEMNNTVFHDAHGLNSNNLSTTPDIAKLLYYIYENHPQILEITKDADFCPPNSLNSLLNRNLTSLHQFPEFIGGKSGYLGSARNTFASIFEIDKEKYAVVIFYSNTPTKDMQKIFEWLKERPRS